MREILGMQFHQEYVVFKMGPELKGVINLPGQRSLQLDSRENTEVF